MVKGDDSVVTLLWDVLNRLSTKQLVVTFLWDVPEVLKEKKSTAVKLRAKQLVVTFLWDVPTELKEKEKIAHQFDHRIHRKSFSICDIERSFVRRCL